MTTISYGWRSYRRVAPGQYIGRFVGSVPRGHRAGAVRITGPIIILGFRATQPMLALHTICERLSRGEAPERLLDAWIN
jgi:hypothetical protein